MVTRDRYAVTDFDSESKLSWPPFVHGEVLDMSFASLYRVSSDPNGRKWGMNDVSGSTVQVALGKLDNPPVVGSWTWTWGADNIILQYDDTAAQIQTKINVGTAMTAAGGCTVRADGPVFIVKWNNAGVRANPSANADDLAPPSLVDFGEVQTGTVSKPHIITFQLIQRPVGLAEWTANWPAAEASVVLIQTGATNLNHKIRVTLVNKPFGGSFNLTVGGQVTDSIPVDVEEADFVAYLEALSNVGTNNVSVKEEGDGQWLITFIRGKAQTNMGESSIDYTGLLSRSAKVGQLDLRSANLQLLFLGAESVSAYLQFDLIDDGAPRRFRVLVTLQNSLIEPSTVGPVPQLSFIGANFRIKGDGTFQLFNPDTNKYNTLTDTGAEGSETTGLATAEA